MNTSIFCLFNKTNHTCYFHALSIVEQFCFFLARRGINLSKELTAVLPTLNGRFCLFVVVVFSLFCNQCLLPFGQDMTERIGNRTLTVHICKNCNGQIVVSTSFRNETIDRLRPLTIR